MNRAAEDFTGLTRFAVVGRSPEDMAPDDRGRALRRAILHAMTSGEVVTEDMDLYTTDGPRRAAVAVSPMHEGSAEIRRVLVSVSDSGQAAVEA